MKRATEASAPSKKRRREAPEEHRDNNRRSSRGQKPVREWWRVGALELKSKERVVAQVEEYKREGLKRWRKVRKMTPSPGKLHPEIVHEADERRNNTALDEEEMVEIPESMEPTTADPRGSPEMFELHEPPGYIEIWHNVMVDLELISAPDLVQSTLHNSYSTQNTG